MCACDNRKGIARSVFYVAHAMPIARKWITRHIPPEANAQNNRIPIARQQLGKQALSTIQAVFSEGFVQSGYKRVEFQSLQLL
jgi:methylphosphotriester-DNA--protein-cysteine methyltransferase